MPPVHHGTVRHASKFEQPALLHGLTSSFVRRRAIHGWMVDSFLDKVGLEPVNFRRFEHRSAYRPGETNPCY
jgi:hypothetical protein